MTCIDLTIERPDGHCSNIEISDEHVTTIMLDAAENLLHTLTTGEHPIIKNLYDLVARAFGTTREDAKERITAAVYGKHGKPLSPPRGPEEHGHDPTYPGSTSCAEADCECLAYEADPSATEGA